MAWGGTQAQTEFWRLLRSRLTRRRLAKVVALSTAGAAVIAGAMPQPASAFKLFGYSFFESDVKPTSPDAQPYKIEVNVTGGDKALTSAVQNAGRAAASSSTALSMSEDAAV